MDVPMPRGDGIFARRATENRFPEERHGALIRITDNGTAKLFCMFGSDDGAQAVVSEQRRRGRGRAV
jgi:hypothetical protein